MKIKKKNEPQKSRLSLANMSTPRKWLIFAILISGVIIALPFAIILLIGLLPTLTVLFTDSKNTQKIIIIGCFNMAGVFIYLMGVMHDYSIGGAVNIIKDIFNLIIMLGSAGLGLILYCELPNLFIFFSQISAQKRLEVIENKLKNMSEEWGQDVIETQVKNGYK